MKLSDYDYHLPKELIAQHPSMIRDQSKLMVLNRENGHIEHKMFRDIVSYFKKGDVLVLNNTSVLPARLIGLKESTKAVIEILMLEEVGKDEWTCLVRKAKKIKVGTKIIFGDGVLSMSCSSVQEDGIRTFKLKYEGILLEILEQLGTLPLPPYITEQLDDQSRYQTVYHKVKGSSAAPTAGLHFTEQLLNKLTEMGINIVYVTLHVGLGTFRPVQVDDVENHQMHSEYYHVDQKVADVLNLAKKESRRIIAVGTTSLRTLETIYDGHLFNASTGHSDIFIYPPYKIKTIDALITNFHLPKSTLLMLVSAFSSRDVIFHAYNEAIKNDYRFFSFGDAMFITK
jgi:S-adenosylmethionine:tRNA ribosyltransferase-isomerase